MIRDHLYNYGIEDSEDKLNFINRNIAKNIMTLAVNMLDESKLNKVQSMLLSLTSSELRSLKNYLDYQKYRCKAFLNTQEYRIIKEISKIVLYSRPQDPYLKEILDEYNANLSFIEELKGKTTQTDNPKTLNKLYKTMDAINKRNTELIEEVNNYKKRKEDS